MLHRNIIVSGLLAVTLFAAGACQIDAESTTTTAAAVEHIDGWDDESLDVYFIPGGVAAEDRIANEIASATQSIRIAMYNVRSERLGWALLERQQAGVAVEVLWDAKQMAKSHNTLDDDLIAAGLNVVGIRNDRTSYATLHDKLVVIDNTTVMMGSANWGNSALHLNNETVLVFRSPGLAATVTRELDEIKSGVKTARPANDNSRAQLYFSPEDRLDLVTEAAIDAATDRIYVAMFSVRWHSLAAALVRAHDRGVAVYVITDRKQSTNSSEDEFLRDHGVTVVEALNEASPYTAMHHKFVVIDGHTTLVGSYNWSYTATFGSYEDLAVIAADPEVAAAFEGEVLRLWDLYGDVAGPAPRTVSIDVRGHCDRTSWGDQLVLVGDLEELGAWDPSAGIVLDGANWPYWSARVELPAGARVRYKLVVVRADGTVWWESGANREVVIPTDGAETGLVIDDAFRY